MVDHEVETPEFLRQLSPKTREFLAGLRPDEVDSLVALVEAPAEDIGKLLKMAKDISTVSKFLRYFILLSISVFVGTIVLWENVLKFVGFFNPRN